MAKFKILYNRETCIGCGSCEQEAPESWEMDYSDSAGVKAKPKKQFFDDVTKKEDTAAKECCPSNSIDIEEVKE